MGCAGVGGVVASILVGKKIIDHKAVWDEVCNKQNQYCHVSICLKSLKETVENYLKAGVLLTRMPYLERAITVLLVFLAIFGGMFINYPYGC